MEKTLNGGSVHFWGDTAQGGSYLLRLAVMHPLEIQFGRFLDGRLLAVPAGHYLYIGSALAEKGSGSLAWRLLRHASRSGTRPAHAIRQVLAEQFSQMNLGPPVLRLPTSKKIRWHIDYLLDEFAVELTAVYMMRSAQKIEPQLARWVAGLEATSYLAKGLGGTDDPGGTHLLRVTVGTDWWAAFPERLSTFLSGVLV